MKTAFTYFLKGKGPSLILMGFFLFFFAASHGYMPLADGLFNRLKFEIHLLPVEPTGEPNKEIDAPAGKGNPLTSQSIKNTKADGAANLAFTRPAVPAAFLGTLAEPGGPLLVIYSSSNPFSRYTTEILLAEGLNEFASAAITSVTASMLSSYDAVIVGDIPLTDAQVTMLTNW